MVVGVNRSVAPRMMCGHFVDFFGSSWSLTVWGAIREKQWLTCVLLTIDGTSLLGTNYGPFRIKVPYLVWYGTQLPSIVNTLSDQAYLFIYLSIQANLSYWVYSACALFLL